MVGYAHTSANAAYPAFLYVDGSMPDLGTLGGEQRQSNGINVLDQVVGQSEIAAGAPHGFLYGGGKTADLNTLDRSRPPAQYVTLVTATGIKGSGRIVANGFDSLTGYAQADLLVPLDRRTGIGARPNRDWRELRARVAARERFRWGRR